MFAHWLAAVAILGLLAAVPGPDVAVVSRCALTGGRAEGLRASVGVVAGLAVWAALAVAGLAALLAASGTVYDAVRLVGAAYLIGLGLWQLRASARRDPDAVALPSRGASAWRAGLLTNLLNPKVAIIYTALLPSLLPHQLSGPVWLSALALTHMTLSFLMLAGYSLVFARSRELMSRPQVRARVGRLMGCVLIGVGIRVATTSR